jgi:hypothetical protein
MFFRLCQIIRASKAVEASVDPTSQISSEYPTGSSQRIERKARNPRSTQRWAGGITNSTNTRKFNKVIDLTAFRDSQKVCGA